MKIWMLSLCLFAGSLLITSVLWVPGFPFFFARLFLAVTPVLLGQEGGAALPGVRMGNYRQRALLPL